MTGFGLLSQFAGALRHLVIWRPREGGAGLLGRASERVSLHGAYELADVCGYRIGDAARARSRDSEFRARRLLRRMLNPEQLKELHRYGGFTVEAPGHGKLCILPTTTFNVLNLQTGNVYCVNTEAFLPLSDLMLAQKLVLETDPDHFFAVANCRSERCAGPLVHQMRAMLNLGEESAGDGREVIWRS
jgi:hypothetical protein